jgi:hypothetical protein
LPPGGGDDADPLAVDRYLEALLAGADRRPSAPAEPDAETLVAGTADGLAPPADLRRAADVVRASLVRVHPSFRFEERLAERLAELASAASTRAAAAGAALPGDVIPFPATAASSGDPLLEAVLNGRLDPSDGDAVARAAGARSPAMPLIVGGAITSAALSIVGVAWVAWRASRPDGAPMGRAARAAHARRLADLAGLPGGPA